jgi:hypothetical protein
MLVLIRSQTHSKGAGVIQPVLEANHSFPSTAVVKKKWSYTYIPSTRLHDLERESFNFTCSKLGIWKGTA